MGLWGLAGGEEEVLVLILGGALSFCVEVMLWSRLRLVLKVKSTKKSRVGEVCFGSKGEVWQCCSN